jgi:hypothetical protein
MSINNLASLLLPLAFLMGGITPVLAQYSCPSREIQMVSQPGDVKFELKDCQRQGRKVVCQQWVTSTKADGGLSFYSSPDAIRIVDLSGEQHRGSSSYNSSLVRDVPMKLTAIFPDVPTTVKDIVLLELSTTVGQIQFRNVKITEAKLDISPTTPATKSPNKRK